MCGIYIHQCGAFTLLGFDNQGNARAFISWTGQKNGSTFEPELNFADIDYQYVTSDDLMH